MRPVVRIVARDGSMADRGGKMMARRSTGKARVARALWYASKGVAELRTAPPAAAGAGRGAGAHAVQRHQPRHRAAGLRGARRPERVGAHARAQCRRARSRSRSNTAIARPAWSRTGPAELIGRNGVLPASAPGLFQRCRPTRWRRCPTAFPPRRATLAANMETALNALWDSGAGPGDRIVVVGAGVVGLLVASLAGAAAGRRGDGRRYDEAAAGRWSRRWAPASRARRTRRRTPTSSSTPAPPPPASTPPSIAPAFEGTIVEMSWYGDKPVQVDLGGAFHSRRLKLVSSQVGRSRRAGGRAGTIAAASRPPCGCWPCPRSTPGRRGDRLRGRPRAHCRASWPPARKASPQSSAIPQS